MKLKFKDGTIIEVKETEGKNKDEIVAEAKQVYKDFKDSQVKDFFEPIKSFKSWGFLKENNQGDEVVALYENGTEHSDDNRLMVICKRPEGKGLEGRPYLIAAGYSPEDGTWNQGYYDFETFEEAEKFLKEKYKVIPFIKDSQVKDESTHMTFNELKKIFDKHNEENNIKHQFEDPNPLYGVIVFSNENAKNGQWKQEYPLESRSYKFTSDNKYFIPHMIGNSIFAECLDGSERIKLTDYMYDWVIEYCYIENM